MVPFSNRREHAVRQFTVVRKETPRRAVIIIDEGKESACKMFVARADPISCLRDETRNLLFGNEQQLVYP